MGKAPDTASPGCAVLSRRREPPDVICNAHEQRMSSFVERTAPARDQSGARQAPRRGCVSMECGFVARSCARRWCRETSPRRGHSGGRLRKPQTFRRPLRDRGTGSGSGGRRRAGSRAAVCGRAGAVRSESVSLFPVSRESAVSMEGSGTRRASISRDTDRRTQVSARRGTDRGFQGAVAHRYRAAHFQRSASPAAVRSARPRPSRGQVAWASWRSWWPGASWLAGCSWAQQITG